MEEEVHLQSPTTTTDNAVTTDVDDASAPSSLWYLLDREWLGHAGSGDGDSSFGDMEGTNIRLLGLGR